MSANPPEMPIAHVYAARFPHDPIEVIGNKSGFERLINVLIDAIGTKGAKETVYTTDGGHHDLRVTCLQGKRRPEEWRRSGSPMWDVEDPLVARILELTEENRRLRKIISTLRQLSKSIMKADALGGPGGTDDAALNSE